MTGKKYGIVVGHDGSELSTRALDWAIEEARLRHTKLTICHFWSYPYLGYAPMVTMDFSEPAADLVRLAAVRARTTAPDLEVQSVVEPGSASRGLIDLGRDADLVVVGTHGRTGMARVLLGSVAEQVVRHAPCSILAVRPDADVKPFVHALCPIDFSDSSRHAMELAGEL
ncbi:MAG: universal stress protein, partial [Streptosporangiaceae bacterium]